MVFRLFVHVIVQLNRRKWVVTYQENKMFYADLLNKTLHCLDAMQHTTMLLYYSIGLVCLFVNCSPKLFIESSPSPHFKGRQVFIEYLPDGSGSIQVW